MSVPLKAKGMRRFLKFCLVTEKDLLCALLYLINQFWQLSKRLNLRMRFAAASSSVVSPHGHHHHGGGSWGGRKTELLARTTCIGGRAILKK